MNKAIDMGFDKGLVSRKLELWLNGQALFVMAQQEFLLARLGW